MLPIFVMIIYTRIQRRAKSNILSKKCTAEFHNCTFLPLVTVATIAATGTHALIRTYSRRVKRLSKYTVYQLQLQLQLYRIYVRTYVRVCCFSQPVAYLGSCFILVRTVCYVGSYSVHGRYYIMFGCFWQQWEEDLDEQRSKLKKESQ